MHPALTITILFVVAVAFRGAAELHTRDAGERCWQCSLAGVMYLALLLRLAHTISSALLAARRRPTLPV